MEVWGPFKEQVPYNIDSKAVLKSSFWKKIVIWNRGACFSKKKNCQYHWRHLSCFSRWQHSQILELIGGSEGCLLCGTHNTQESFLKKRPWSQIGIKTWESVKITSTTLFKIVCVTDGPSTLFINLSLIVGHLHFISCFPPGAFTNVGRLDKEINLSFSDKVKRLEAFKSSTLFLSSVTKDIFYHLKAPPSCIFYMLLLEEAYWISLLCQTWKENCK